MEWLHWGGILIVTNVLAFVIGARYVRRTAATEVGDDGRREAKETVECLNALLDALPNHVFLLGPDGVQALNHCARRAWGVDREDRLAIHDITASARDAERMALLLDGEGVSHIRLRLRDASGRVFPCDIVAVRATIRGQQIVIADSRDVSRREEMEQRVRLADRVGATGMLAAGIAHEINNPLTYVASNIAYVLDGLPSGERELIEALEDSKTGVARVTSIVQELRQLSGIDSAEDASTPLARPLRIALRLTKHVLRHNCEVISRFDDELPDVVGDDSRLAQVFVNLLTTAADMMPPRRAASVNRVIIEARVDPTFVEVCVSDNGEGLSAAEVEYVFDPFYASPEVDGDGQLGLAIAHGIVEHLGGEMEVRSEHGVGTTVCVTLRRSEPSVRSVRQPTPTARTAVGQRLLLIDDEPNVLRGMQRVLSRHYIVVTAASGRAAIDLLQNGDTYDAILCDLMMPDMTGNEVLVWLQEHRPELTGRFAIVTGGAVGRELQEFLTSANVRVLRKPLARAELLTAIDDLSS